MQSETFNDRSYKKCQNTPFSTLNPRIKIFSQNSGRVTFFTLLTPNFMQSFKTNEQYPRFLKINQWTDGPRTDKGDYKGPPRVNPRSKIGFAAGKTKNNIMYSFSNLSQNKKLIDLESPYCSGINARKHMVSLESRGWSYQMWLCFCTFLAAVFSFQQQWFGLRLCSYYFRNCVFCRKSYAVWQISLMLNVV